MVKANFALHSFLCKKTICCHVSVFAVEMDFSLYSRRENSLQVRALLLQTTSICLIIERSKLVRNCRSVRDMHVSACETSFSVSVLYIRGKKETITAYRSGTAISQLRKDSINIGKNPSSQSCSSLALRYSLHWRHVPG